MYNKGVSVFYSLKAIRNLIILLFLSTAIIFYVMSKKDLQKRTEIVLEEQIDYLHKNYKVTTNFFKTLSENTYNTLLSRPDVLKLLYQANQAKSEQRKAQLRQRLYKIMRPHFEQLRYSGVNIILFSFPNNKTFLRVHKVGKFNDDLSAVRYSFTYVNKEQKAVQGFEQGKISHAFRNIRPLYYKDEFVGSVDISFSSEIMQENMRRVHGVDTHFIINKEVFDSKIWKGQNQVRYEQSIEHDNFLFAIPKKRDFLPAKIEINKELKNEISKGVKTENAFSLHYSVNESVYIISFSPIKNIKEHKTVAYLVSYVKSPYLEELYKEYLWVNGLFFIGLFLVSLLFYRNIKHRFLLQELVDQEVSKNREKDFLVTQQARHAQMGEMISMIAHQWRQPLASISAAVNLLVLKGELADDDKMDSETNETLKRIENYTQSLSSTIDEFREFFKEDREKIKITLETIIDDSFSMVEDILKSEGVVVQRDYNSYGTLMTYPNELKQVMLNLIKNTQDIFNQRDVSDGKIYVKTYADDSYCYILFEDNAGGIKDDIIDKIFDPYFTTKSSLNATGLGLYMSKKIIEEHCHGLMSVENVKQGARFTLKLRCNVKK